MLKIRLNSEERTITLGNIKMNQDTFSYNSVTFTKIDDNNVLINYKKEIVEDTQENKDLGLSWALEEVFFVLNYYSKPGCNPYNKDYRMFEYEISQSF